MFTSVRVNVVKIRTSIYGEELAQEKGLPSLEFSIITKQNIGPPGSAHAVFASVCLWQVTQIYLK